jgi:hypothetical protein
MNGNQSPSEADSIIRNDSLRRPIRVGSPSWYSIAGDYAQTSRSGNNCSLFKIKIHKRTLSECILLCREQQDDRQEDFGEDCFHSLLRFVSESSWTTFAQGFAFSILIAALRSRQSCQSGFIVLASAWRFHQMPIGLGTKKSTRLATVGFPNIGLQGFAPKFARDEIASLSGAGDDARYFQISVVLADGHHAAGQFGRGAGG